MSIHKNGKKNTSPVSRKKIWLITAGAIPVILLLLLLLSVVALRWVNPAFTSFTLREDWESLDRERHNLREYWVKADELPDHLKWAVIASEDQRFYEHAGLDWAAIEMALDERDRGVRQRGASTITQQLAKNLYLWPGQSWIRKALEAGITVLIEVFWNKDRIMEMYLNIAEFGPGLYGAGKATSVWYGKAATELTPVESARMAAVLSSPKRMRVEPPSPYTTERSRWILQQMKQITGIEYRPIPPGIPTDVHTDTIRLPSELYINPFDSPDLPPGTPTPPADSLINQTDTLRSLSDNPDSSAGIRF
jgi:monofunctional glycosyltransferase